MIFPKNMEKERNDFHSRTELILYLQKDNPVFITLLITLAADMFFASKAK